MAQATNPKIEELRFRVKTDAKSRLFFPLAEELRKIGQFGEAETVLRTGLEHHPTYLSAWVSLGRVLRDQKNDRAAVDALTRALQLDPGNVVAARLLADAYLALGEPLEALKKYKLVHALMPGDQDLEGVIARIEEELNPIQVVAPAPAPEPAPEPEPVAAAHESRGEDATAPLSRGEDAAAPLSTESRHEDSPWSDAAASLFEEQHVGEQTLDVQPMS